MQERCAKDKDHFDGGSFLGGLVLGVVAMLVPCAIWLPGPAHTMLWRTDTGVTCHVDKLYPSASCAALLSDLGPRLSKAKVEK